MPAHIYPHLHSTIAPTQEIEPVDPNPPLRVHLSREDGEAVVDIHRTLTGKSYPDLNQYSEPHLSFGKFLEAERQAGKKRSNLGVCFTNLTTWGEDLSYAKVKTLGTSLFRTLTLQDVYEWTVKPWVTRNRQQDGRPLIRNFSGVVRNGEIILVLGRPGSGCSTFLRTISGHHSSFLRVTGSVDYSGLSIEEVQKHYRGQIAYVPEDDVHFPTLSVRQTLEFALECKTPKRYRERIPKYLDVYGKVFGMSHTMNTLVGDQYIRGVSGGERKRISIIESLATDSLVTCFDNSTRGLDASSALDYARSLRIMTDTCGKATFLTLYQASDAIYELVDKVLLIDDGRMLFQGPAREAKKYFEGLGYMCADMQTTSDFLTSITVPEIRRFRPGWEHRAPKGAIELESAFQQSAAYHKLEEEIRNYEDERAYQKSGCTSQTNSDYDSVRDLEESFKSDKSRFAPSKSSYTISLFRQVLLCSKRQLWQLKGHMGPSYVKMMSSVVYGLLIGSMFYDQPHTTDGMYSRGGVLMYSSILLAWLQMSELEDAMQGREILNRQKRYAFVQPSAVCLARIVVDFVVTFVLVSLYLPVVYFLSGLRPSAGPFFIDFLFIYSCTICLTSQFRFFAAFSKDFEVALRYCGASVLLCVVFAGYVLSVDKLMRDVPWVGWIAYITPALYTYEPMVAAEFHNTNFTCDSASIVPSGPNYTDVAYQTCGYTGSKVGSLVISGDDYLAARYGFYYSHVWRDFGILIAFTVAYVALTCWLNEVLEWEPDNAGPIQYKGSLKGRNNEGAGSNDEESCPVQVDPKAPALTGYPGTGPSTTLAGSRSTFSWDKLELSVQAGKETKTLLNGVYGYCKPGTLTALVGSSGAGKSTLLTALTQRGNPGPLSGTIFVGGRSIDQSFNRQIGYCQQMDIHDETSTVREALEFSAILRQNPEISLDAKISYVDGILSTLGLVELQDAVIGSLDIEKKKRVTIGVELCARPKLLLFLDEPTSGLDSQGASSIVGLLRRLADQGLAILCTIHQANQHQFEQFDRVLALGPGGSMYYFGRIGEAGASIFEYFKKHGKKPENVTNAADFLIEVVAGGIKDAKHSIDWVDVWNKSGEAEAIRREILDIRLHAQSEGNESVSSPPSSAPLLQQIVLLTQRASRQFWRSPEYPYSRLYASVLHSLINGLTFLQIGNSATDMQSKAFSCFLVLMIVPEFINAISMRFILNRDLWKVREGPSGVYGWVAFCTSQILSEIPYAIVSAVLFYVLYYYLVGLPLGFAAGYSFLMCFFFFLYSTSWGQWIAAMSADSIVAATLMPFFIIMCELFTGILRPHSQMPVIWEYTMYYVTPFTYWIGGVLTSVLRGMPVICEPNELIIFRSPPDLTCEEYAGPWLVSKGVGYLSNPDEYGLCGYCEYSYGDDYLSWLELDSSKIWPYFGIFVGFVVSNYLMVYLLVYLRSVMKPFWRRG